MQPLWDERYTPADDELIKQKARRMAGHYGWRRDDVDDIAQDLATHLFQQAHRHEPGRGPRERFISTVLKHKLLQLIEYRMAQKRNTRRNVSVESCDERVWLDGHRPQTQIDLEIDVRDVLATLPAPLRELANLLEHYTPAEAQRMLGLTRAQVRSRMAQIEQAFRLKDLDPNAQNQQPIRHRFR